METQTDYEPACRSCNKIAKRNGKDRCGNQRYRCVECNITFSEPKAKTLNNMYLSEEKAITCLQLLVEGMSVRGVERVTGTHRDTVLKLLETVGKKCLWIQESLVKNLKVRYLQADEVWSYIAMKDKTKHINNINDPKIGSAYTFTCIDSETKLIAAWHLGRRNEQDALTFLNKVYNAVDGGSRYFQFSTDGWAGYDHTVNEVLGSKAHYGQLVKQYSNPPLAKQAEQRYSPSECVGCVKKVMHGNPIKKRISTSHVERQNLTMRMSMRRMTRLTNGFSKKWDNLNYSIALHFAHYNFVRSHKSLNGATPAMAAGLTNTIWSLKDLLETATHI